MQGFAAGAATGVDGQHAGLGCQHTGDLLRAQILLFKPAIVKGFAAEQGRVTTDNQGIVLTFYRLAGNLLVAQQLLQLVAVTFQAVDPDITQRCLSQHLTLGGPLLTQLTLGQLIQPFRAAIFQQGPVIGFADAGKVDLKTGLFAFVLLFRGAALFRQPGQQQAFRGFFIFSAVQLGNIQIEVQPTQNITGGGDDTPLFNGRDLAA